MRTTDNAFWRYLLLPTLMAFSVALISCGGGSGGDSTSSNPAGTASVSVSMASAPGFPAGTPLAAPLAEPVPTAKPVPVVFDNVMVSVTKLALIPSSGTEYPNPDGEPEQQNAPAEEGTNGMPGFVTATFPSPVTIDLYHAPPPFETSLYLCNFDEVPPGEYSKIRVYYDNVVGRTRDPSTDNVLFHPTANYHFDVHFVGGNLVVPGESSMPGVRAIAVVINVVGLKITQAGNSGNFLMRPQVFSTVESPAGLVFLVHGEAENVNQTEETFLIRTDGNQTVSAAFDAATKWFYVDELVDPSSPYRISEGASNALGPEGLKDTAIVDVIGSFSPDMVLQAEEIKVTLPVIQPGVVVDGWTPDNTFILRSDSMDNTVFPMPDRENAYYDNAVTHLPLPLGDSYIDNNSEVVARGYAVDGMPGGIEAFWISIVNP